MNTAEQKLLLIQNSNFFKDFDKTTVDAIVPLMKECNFKADAVICAKGNDSDCLYLISEGQAEISVSSRDGKIIVLGTLSKGDIFGEIGLLDKAPRTADVAAKSDVSLYKLSGADFSEIAKKFTLKEWASITRHVCRLFRHVANNLEETSFLDSEIRVFKKILEIYKKSPEKEKGIDTFKLNISQETLGRMVGLSREATNKILSRLCESGLVEKKYKYILIPSIKKFCLKVEKDS